MHLDDAEALVFDDMQAEFVFHSQRRRSDQMPFRRKAAT